MCVSGLLCLLAEGHCAWSHSSDLERLSAQATLFPKGECDHAILVHFADPATGVRQGGSRALALTTLR